MIDYKLLSSVTVKCLSGLLLFAVSQTAFAQTIEWESAFPTTDLAGATGGNNRSLNLSDTVMVFAGRTNQYGILIPSGTLYGHDCLMWVHPENLRPPRMMLLPSYGGIPVFCGINGEVHGIDIDIVSGLAGHPRMVYFRCSSAGEILDTLFLEAPEEVYGFDATAMMDDRRMLVCSRIRDPQELYVPWLGLFDIRTLSWVWQKQLLSQAAYSAGAWRGGRIFGNRVLVTGNRGQNVYYAIVDSTGPVEQHDLWRKPDTTRGFIYGQAGPRPGGGWTVQATDGGGIFALLDANLTQTYYSTETGTPFTMLADGGYLTVKTQGADYHYCKIDAQG